MNHIYNPCIFQGQNQMKMNKEYFEGWYFKNTNQKETVSFIPGIAISSNKKEAFIQVITQDSSWYIPYPITEFSYSDYPFEIKIGNSYFSNTKVELHVSHSQVQIDGTLQYQGNIEIKHHLLSPNIMGIFSFVPHMECNHAIVSMKHSICGNIEINHKILTFENGIGYIEKDWGTSFPSSYIWGQANCFPNQTASLFFAIATIPFHHFQFQGLICNFILNGNEYRFATYNGSKIIINHTDNQGIHIILEKHHMTLEIIGKSNQTSLLKAPQNGKMKNHIQESIQAEIELILKQDTCIIYQGKSTCAGLEII